jgi:hypothetical protein
VEGEGISAAQIHSCHAQVRHHFTYFFAKVLGPRRPQPCQGTETRPSGLWLFAALARKLGEAITAQSRVINSRRLIAPPRLNTGIVSIRTGHCGRPGCQVGHVRFGSKADMCAAISHVPFTPNSDRKSRHCPTLKFCHSFTDTSEYENCGPLLRSEGHIAFVYKPNRATRIERISIENLLTLFAIRGARRLIARKCDDSDRLPIGAGAGRPSRTRGAGWTSGTSRAGRPCLTLGWRFALSARG